jgi:hypothetical protein
MLGSHALPTRPPLSTLERPHCQHCQTRTILGRTAPGGLRIPHFRVPQM